MKIQVINSTVYSRHLPSGLFSIFFLRGGDGCTQAIEVIDTEKNFQLIPYKIVF